MRTPPGLRHWRCALKTAAALAAATAAANSPAPLRADPPGHVTLWDTAAPDDSGSALARRPAWAPVPVDLLTLEKNPFKAWSDPAYYGRAYVFKGDAAVENAHCTALFCSARGRVVVCLPAVAAAGASAAASNSVINAVEIAPLSGKSEPLKIRELRILQNSGDQIVLDAVFSSDAADDASATFTFDNTGLIGIRPGPGARAIRVSSSIAYGVAPDFVGDDLIFDPARYPTTRVLYPAAQNLFLGLIRGENEELVMAWPGGSQEIELRLGADRNHPASIRAIDIRGDAQPVCLSVLQAPGIWHRQELSSSYLERDVAIPWRRPFPAKWRTQLAEAGIKVAYGFRESKSQIWRGVAGMYEYPVWFDGAQAWFHLSKKVPPEGDALIYFVEGKNTPASIETPVDLLKAALGRPLAEAVLDVPGRQLRTHHRRGGDGVRRACTCGCTEAIQAVFESGEETAEKHYVEGAVGDMLYFVERHVARIGEYQQFAGDLIQYVQLQENSSPDLKPYLDSIERLVRQIPDEYNVQKENMQSLPYAGELARRTIALTRQKERGNLPAYLELGKEWRAMGGAQDYYLAECNRLTRQLFQEAGYQCALDSKAVPLAQEIRRRCRQTLRNPDGYEIWPSY